MLKWRSLLIMILAGLIIAASGRGSSVEAAERKTITILGTSDLHGRFMPWDYQTKTPNTSGSLAQLSTLIKQVCKGNPNTILVDNGDTIQGNRMELFQDHLESPMMAAMNAMGYDTWTFGNHEFNFGLWPLIKTSSQFKGRLISGNIYKNTGGRLITPYAIIEKSDVRIALIGMTTSLTEKYEHGTDHLKGLHFTNPADETAKIIKELEGRVDAIVGVMHLGLENEAGIPGTGARDVAAANPELAAILTGHAHEYIPGEAVNGVLIVQPGKHGAFLAKIDLVFTRVNDKYELTEKESTLIPIRKGDGSHVKIDAEMEKLLYPFHRFLMQAQWK